MTFFKAAALTLSLACCAIPAQAQEATPLPVITLNPGETVLKTILAHQPAIIAIPVKPAAKIKTVTINPVVPYEIDRVRGIPRNRAGWTGDHSDPAAIACFPKGVCANLNQ